MKMKRFGSTKQGRFIVICCSIVVLMLVTVMYYPLGYTRLEPTELGEFIDSRNDLWPQLFSDFYSAKGNITRFDGIANGSFRKRQRLPVCCAVFCSDSAHAITGVSYIIVPPVPPSPGQANTAGTPRQSSRGREEVSLSHAGSSRPACHSRVNGLR